MEEGTHRFSKEQRGGLYRAIYERRDVRSFFKPDHIPDAVLARLLDAAHHAPSVGFMQPWGFIIIRDQSVRHRVHDMFDLARRSAAEIYTDDRRAKYDTLKLAGILEAPLNLCVTCDEMIERGHGLGRQTIHKTALYSTVCAIQNLWLAARAEGVGVGWVSILDIAELRAALAIPESVEPVAYLCLGYVTEFAIEPELETEGWQKRAPLKSLIHFENYGVIDENRAVRLLRSVTSASNAEHKS